MESDRVITYELRQVDLLRARADAVALKYARDFHGADRAVAEAFMAAGRSVEDFRVPVDDYSIASTDGLLRAETALFVGVPPLHEFHYREIRRFSAMVLTILAREAPQVRTVAMTLHGPGIGLDILEAARQQLLGVRDATSAGSYPESLDRVVIAEVVPERLQAAELAIMEEFGAVAPPPGWESEARTEWPIHPVAPPRRTRTKTTRAIRATVQEVAQKPEEKGSVFVAMPFARRMRDVWKFGIREPVRRAGFICERMDEDSFTGEVMARIRKNIEEADLVIADLTGDNPNVFLEVGYAWGRERPTLFLCRRSTGDGDDRLPFDVSGHKCLFYEDATDLEEQITNCLPDLLG